MSGPTALGECSQWENPAVVEVVPVEGGWGVQSRFEDLVLGVHAEFDEAEVANSFARDLVQDTRLIIACLSGKPAALKLAEVPDVTAP